MAGRQPKGATMAGAQIIYWRISIIAALYAAFSLGPHASRGADLVAEAGRAATFEVVPQSNGKNKEWQDHQHAAPTDHGNVTALPGKPEQGPGDEIKGGQNPEEYSCNNDCPEHRDLLAQEDMAHSTKFAMYAAWAGVAVGSLSLGLLWCTAVYAKKAAKAAEGSIAEARRSVATAERAIREAQVIGQAQFRAYISLVKPNIEMSQNGPMISAVIKNSGSSPARNINIIVNLRISSLQTFGLINNQGNDGNNLQNTKEKFMTDLPSGSDECVEFPFNLGSPELYIPAGVDTGYKIFVDVIIKFFDVFNIPIEQEDNLFILVNQNMKSQTSFQLRRNFLTMGDEPKYKVGTAI